MLRTLMLSLAALTLAAGAALAQAPAATSPSLAVSVVNRTAAAAATRGTARRDSAVRAGDTLRYTLRFTNPGPQPVREVALSNPLPASLRLVAGSPKASRPDARLEFSADGGRTYSPTPEETVVVEGRRVRRPVPAERFTHVRLTVAGALAPGASVSAVYDATLVVVPSPTPAARTDR